MEQENSIEQTNKVRIERWPGPIGPVVGPSLIVADMDRAAEALAGSGFMQPWIIEQIKVHLRKGGTFTNHGQTRSDYEPAIQSNGQTLYLQVRSEYRMASREEVLNYVDTQQAASVVGHAISRRAQEKGYVLHYHEGVDLIKSYDDLPRQAKIVLDILSEAGRDNFTEASIEVLLTEQKDRLRTRQDPMKIFGFYRKVLLDQGHLEES